MCIVDLITIRCDTLTCLSAQSENVEVWQERNDLMNVSLLHKLMSRDLFPGLNKMKFADDKGCGVGVKEK